VHRKRPVARGLQRGVQSPGLSASKADLIAKSQTMAQAPAPYGVCSYMIVPGFLKTDRAKSLLHVTMGHPIHSQSPLESAAVPEGVARTVAFLASDPLDFMTDAIVDVNGASCPRA